jgi:hypothetical protein
MRVKTNDFGELEKLDHVNPSLPILHRGDQRLIAASATSLCLRSASLRYWASSSARRR